MDEFFKTFKAGEQHIIVFVASDLPVNKEYKLSDNAVHVNFGHIY